MLHPFTCDLVIARYKEPLTWMKLYENYNFREIIVYNKGPNDRACNLKGKRCKNLDLTNEGRCDHTYLYHIIHNYDTLADVTIFTKGSSDMHRERKKLAFTVKKVFETKDTVFSVSQHNTPLHVDAAKFTMSVYRASHPANQTDISMKLADIRPFGKWYEAHFPNISITSAVYSGVFAVSKKHIHQHTKEYYMKLIKELEGHPNPEVGHYFERAWLAIFHPIPYGCQYESLFAEQHFGGSRKMGTRKLRKLKRRRYRHTR